MLCVCVVFVCVCGVCALYQATQKVVCVSCFFFCWVVVVVSGNTERGVFVCVGVSAIINTYTHHAHKYIHLCIHAKLTVTHL